MFFDIFEDDKKPTWLDYVKLVLSLPILAMYTVGICLTLIADIILKAIFTRLE